MSAGEPTAAAPREKIGLLEKFRADLARDGLSVKTAAFSDKAVEKDYQAHLHGVSFAALRLFAVGGPLVWFGFGILDFLAVKEGAGAVAMIRWLIVGPITAALAISFFIPALQRYYSWIITTGLLVFSLGIIAMIAIIPPEGAPPYVIGILVTFAYASCFLRVSFPLAASAYATSTIAYCTMLSVMPKFSEVDVISGYFFTINIAVVAIVTHYAQEIRTRQIWRRNCQRALDAAHIEELLIEATAADQSKLNFISILSHELRTPLHQIIGFTEIVIQRFADGDGARSDEFLNDIRTSAHDLLSRIAKMLRFADATAGKIKYEPESVSSRELIETVMTQAKSLSMAKNVEIDAEGVADVDIWVDHPHTAYGLGHIVENAIKASKRDGKIFLRGRQEPDGSYTFAVEDQGIGMSPEQIKAAFEPFSQVQQVRTRSLDGLGLGLTLARKIFQDQGADLSIASAQGEGTTASIKFPPRKKAAAA